MALYEEAILLLLFIANELVCFIIHNCSFTDSFASQLDRSYFSPSLYWWTIRW